MTFLARLRNPDDHTALENEIRGRPLQPVAGLHFLSMFVIPPNPDEGHTDAWLGLEANFDGRLEEFLPELIAANGDLLHDAFQHCVDYGGRARLLDYLVGAQRRNQLFYIGCPGRTVQQIAEEAGLAARVSQGIAGLEQRQGRRSELVREVFNNLDDDDRYNIFHIPRRPFWVRLALLDGPLRAIYCALQWLLFLVGAPTFILVAAAALGSPVWPSVAPPRSVIDAMACWALGLGIGVAVLTLLWLALLIGEFPAELTRRVRVAVFWAKLWEFLVATAGAIPGFLALLGVLAFLHWHPRLVFGGAAAVVALIVLVLLVWFLFWLVRLMRIGSLEPDDAVADLSWNLEHARRRVREDNGPQNHFISVTTIRPGALRMATLRGVLCLIHWGARILHNPRGLFNTQSIHFARWAIIPGRRLLFISNYDGSFGGYLGIFATLGAVGVSAIWGNTVGFPRTFLLLLDGARDEQRFKARARSSQVETLVWYRRYPELTVGAIETNAAIRKELARFSRGGAPEAEYDAFLRRFSAPRP